MFVSEVKIRVRYAETDKMGYCYYGNYATYFEIARVEALRTLGVSYKELEDSGIMLPVSDMSIKYLKPAFYDEEILVRTTISELPGVKFKFSYECFNEQNEKLNFADTTLVFISEETRKPTRAPEKLLNELKKYIEDE